MLATHMTSPGLWRTAVDLHIKELETCVGTTRQLLMWFIDGEDPRIPPEDSADLYDLERAWMSSEHALANYGAVLNHRWWMLTQMEKPPGWRNQSSKINRYGLSFKRMQEIVRAEGWPYSRPAWATDPDVLLVHRQRLVELRPEFYSVKFKMETGNL